MTTISHKPHRIFFLYSNSSRKSQAPKDSQRIRHMGKTWITISPTFMTVNMTDVQSDSLVVTQPNHVPTHLQ